jgi:hypothetical protein
MRATLFRVAKPDLGKVDEIGFSDLMPGGLIPSSSRVRWFEVNANWVQGRERDETTGGK